MCYQLYQLIIHVRVVLDCMWIELCNENLITTWGIDFCSCSVVALIFYIPCSFVQWQVVLRVTLRRCSLVALLS